MTNRASATPRVPRVNRRRSLTGVGAFDAVFERGRRTSGRWIELVVADAASPPGRAGLVVGRKALPHAVDRNRLKRRVREALRAARPAIDAYDVIVRLKRPAPGAELDDASTEARRMIEQLARGH